MSLIEQPVRHPLWTRASAWLAQLAPTTQRTYVSVIREYCAFLGAPAGSPQAAVLCLSAESIHALAYTEQLRRQRGQAPRVTRVERGRKGGESYTSRQCPATIAKKIMCLRKFYEVLIAHKLFAQVNPFSPHMIKIPNPNGGRKRDTEMVPFKFVPALIASISEGPRARRDRAIISILFGGGLRRGELTKILISDVSRTALGTTFLRLRSTKDGGDHNQALPEWAAQAVWALVDARKKSGARLDDPLFTTWTGKGGEVPTNRPMNDASVYLVFRAACARCGLGPQYTPHSARATAITKLLSDGTPHREVQEFSRHKSVAMVEWYDKRRFSVDQSPAKGLVF